MVIKDLLVVLFLTLGFVARDESVTRVHLVHLLTKKDYDPSQQGYLSCWNAGKFYKS